MTDQIRNLNPHAEARAAMVIWSEEYASQRGGSMDFWDTLPDHRKRLCAKFVDDILSSGRAKSQDASPQPRLRQDEGYLR